jgi:hypothetical protein
MAPEHAREFERDSDEQPREQRLGKAPKAVHKRVGPES